MCGSGVGCFIFAPIGGMLVDTFDWKKAMLIIAVVVLTSVVCGMFMVPLKPSKRRRKPRERNLLDRFMERIRRDRTGQRHDSISSESEMGSIAKHRVDRSEPPGNGDDGKTTTVPRIVVGSETHSCLEEVRCDDDAGISVNQSMERVPTAAPMRYALPSHIVADMSNGVDEQDEQESSIWRCLRLPKVAKLVLQNMLNLSLFKNPIFIVVCLGNVFGMIGLFVPFVYLADKAMIMGVPENRAVFLISVIGKHESHKVKR